MDKPIFYYKDPEFQWMSHFYRCANGIWYRGHWSRTAEGHFHAWKKNAKDPISEILRQDDPLTAKRMGRKVNLRPDWNDVRIPIMCAIDTCKILQNHNMFRRLVNTGDRPIYEDSPHDNFWGTGTLNGTGPGKNWSGVILMEIRRQAQMGLIRPDPVVIGRYNHGER